MSLRSAGCALAAMLALATWARAEDKPAGAEGKPAQAEQGQAALFGKLDANNDGQVTADEVSPELKRMFERLVRNSDKNSDGKLSKDEFLAGLKDQEPSRAIEGGRGGPPTGAPNPEEFFKRVDANGDGKIVLDEVPADLRGRFEEMLKNGDKDNDKAISREEFAAVARGLAKLPAGALPGFPAPEEILKRLDANSDGKITADEVPSDLKDKFAQLRERADKNSDGTVTREELIETAKSAARRPDGEGRPNPEAIFTKLDRNGDGKIEQSEVPEEVKERFIGQLLQKADKDGDKTVTKEEFLAAAPAGRPEGSPDKRPEGRPEPGRLFGILDKNADGKLTADELPEERRVMIERADKDGDKALSKQEWEQAVQAFKAKREEGDGKSEAKPERAKPAEKEAANDNNDEDDADDAAEEPKREDARREGDRPDAPRREGDRPDQPRREGDRPDAARREGDRPDARREEERRPDPPRGEGRRPDAPPEGRRPDGPPPEGRRPDGPPPEGRRFEGRPPFGFGGGLFGAIDTNRDGKLSAEEIEQAPAALKKLDRNGDNVVTGDEVYGPRPDGDRRPGGPPPRRPETGDRPRGEGERPRGEADRPRPDAERPRGEGDRPRAEGERPRGEGDRRPEGDRPRGEGDQPRREGDKKPEKAEG